MAKAKLTVPLFRNEQEYDVGIPRPNGGSFLLRPGQVCAGALYTQCVSDKMLSPYRPGADFMKLLPDIVDLNGELADWASAHGVVGGEDGEEVEVTGTGKASAALPDPPRKFLSQTKEAWARYLSSATFDDLMEMPSEQLQGLARFMSVEVSGTDREVAAAIRDTFNPVDREAAMRKSAANKEAQRKKAASKKASAKKTTRKAPAKKVGRRRRRRAE